MMLALLMVALLVGCGIGETPAPNGEEEEEGEEGDASGSNPLASLPYQIMESQEDI